jgi:hypothetical protein
VGWFKRKDRGGLLPGAYARVLVDAFVSEGSRADAALPMIFGVSAPYDQELLKLIWRYRAVCVFYCAMRRANDPGYREVFMQLQEIILQDVELDRDVMAQFIGQTLAEIQRLVEDGNGEDLPVLWAKEKLLSAGIEQENPVKLAEFCFHWLEVVERCAAAMAEVKVRT